jgi:predicted ABC-type sugar transport system permease subunit
MSVITFDTFKFVERLEKAGLSRDQAAAIVEAQQVAFSEALDTSLATKADMAKLEAKLASPDSKIESMELRLTIKLGAFLAVFAGVIIAALRVPL